MREKINWLSALMLICALSLTLMFTVGLVKAQGQGNQRQPFHFSLVPASAAIASCLPDATAEVTVFPKSDVLGTDTMDLTASGLPPNTDFVVFLTQNPAAGTPPFGAVQYMGDFTTNSAGRGSVRINAIIIEAFSSTLVGGTRVRQDLNHVTVWFADPAGDDICFGPGGGPVTPFDGDGTAGAAVLSSNNFLPGAPLPPP
jgi:hypothetical protein